MRLRLSESLDFATKDRHDPEKGVVYGVKVLGLGSRNGREYRPEAIREAHGRKLYDGRAVYLNHPAGKGNARNIEDRFARLREVRLDGKGELYADLHYNPKHPFAPTFAHLVDHDPDGIGLSQNAEGTGKRRPGKTTLVESIDVVHSVDLVDGPATTLGLFEQDTSMNGMGGADPAAEVPGETGGGDWRAQLAELVKTITADESMSPDEIKTKLMAALKLLDEHEDEPSDEGESEAESEAAESEESGPPDDEMMEQLRVVPLKAVRRAVRFLDTVRLKEQAKRAGLADEALTPTFLATLREAAANPKKVAALIDDRRRMARGEKAGGTKPKSSPRDAVKLTEQGGKDKPADKIADLVATYFSDVPQGDVY